MWKKPHSAEKSAAPDYISDMKKDIHTKIYFLVLVVSITYIHTYIHILKVLSAERSSSGVKMVLLCKVESLELLGHCRVHDIHTYIHT